MQKTSKKSKKDSRFGSCVNCFVGVFCWLKKKTRADDRQTKTKEVCCSFGVPTTFEKKAKKGEKRRKRISLPHNTFL